MKIKINSCLIYHCISNFAKGIVTVCKCSFQMEKVYNFWVENMNRKYILNGINTLHQNHQAFAKTNKRQSKGQGGLKLHHEAHIIHHPLLHQKGNASSYIITRKKEWYKIFQRRINSHSLCHSISLNLSYFIWSIVINLLLPLSYKLNFIIGMHYVEGGKPSILRI